MGCSCVLTEPYNWAQRQVAVARTSDRGVIGVVCDALILGCTALLVMMSWSLAWIKLLSPHTHRWGCEVPPLCRDSVFYCFLLLYYSTAPHPHWILLVWFRIGSGVTSWLVKTHQCVWSRSRLDAPVLSLWQLFISLIILGRCCHMLFAVLIFFYCQCQTMAWCTQLFVISQWHAQLVSSLQHQ